MMAGKPFDAFGVLVRELHVRVINVSASGILVESERQIAVSRLGRLRLLISGDEFIDDVVVVRCQRIEGAGVYHIAMRFMSTITRHQRSIRRALAQQWRRGPAAVEA